MITKSSLTSHPEAAKISLSGALGLGSQGFGWHNNWRHQGRMHTGKVVWFNDSKGYGLIETEAGQTVFVHYSSIMVDGFKSLNPGQKVEFDLYEDVGKGYLARNVVSC